MKRFGMILVALAFSLIGTSLYADWAKIGVVDLQKIMQQSSQLKTIQENLEKQFKPRQDKLIAAETALKAEMEKFKRDSAILSATQKKEIEKKIVSTQQQFERDGQQYQQELSTAQNEAMEGLYTKVRAAISKTAKDEKYDLIIQKDAVPYSTAELDVTDKVIKAIN